MSRRSLGAGKLTRIPGVGRQVSQEPEVIMKHYPDSEQTQNEEEEGLTKYDKR